MELEAPSTFLACVPKLEASSTFKEQSFAWLPYYYPSVSCFLSNLDSVVATTRFVFSGMLFRLLEVGFEGVFDVARHRHDFHELAHAELREAERQIVFGVQDIGFAIFDQYGVGKQM